MPHLVWLSDRPAFGMVTQGSPGMPACIVALLLACGAPALAERAMSTLDDGVSLMQIARQSSSDLLQVDKASHKTVPAPGSYIKLTAGVPCSDQGYEELSSIDECHDTAKNSLGLASDVTISADSSVFAYGCSRVCSGDDSGACFIYWYSDKAGSIPLPTNAYICKVPEVSATGDPHVTNVDGARFDIMKVGVHEFLRLPRRASQSRGSVEPEPLLSVLAAVQRPSKDECRESYVKQVDVTGVWLNSSGPLRFRAEGGSLDAARAIVLSINGSQVDALSLGRDSRVKPFLEVMEPRAPRANPVSGAIQKVPLFAVQLSFAAATLKIDWTHRKVPGGLSMNHLNFQAFGLRKILESGMDIGGILGRDDHSDATSLPKECKLGGADLRASGRASIEEGDRQVIAAAL